MKQLHSAMTFFLVTISAVIGCDMLQPDNHKNTIPIKKEPTEVPHTKDESEELLRIDLDDPEASLVTVFSDVLTGAREDHHIKQSRTVVIFCDEPPVEVSVATEGLTLSRLDGGFFLSVHGIPATLADTAKAGKEFCRLFESAREDEAAVDEWVINHNTRLDKTLSFIRDVNDKEVELHLRSSFQADLPFRIYAQIYFGRERPEKRNSDAAHKAK